MHGGYEEFGFKRWRFLSSFVCIIVFQLDYPKAKNLNLTEFELEPNEHFNNIPVNLTLSTVHVPTNVYDECKS